MTHDDLEAETKLANPYSSPRPIQEPLKGDRFLFQWLDWCTLLPLIGPVLVVAIFATAKYFVVDDPQSPTMILLSRACAGIVALSSISSAVAVVASLARKDRDDWLLAVIGALINAFFTYVMWEAMHL
jgi:hypothetical protein